MPTMTLFHAMPPSRALERREVRRASAVVIVFALFAAFSCAVDLSLALH